MSLELAVRNVNDYRSLVALLAGDDLHWDLDPDAAQEDVSFDWSGDELHLSDSASRRLNGGVVKQLRLPISNSPWGIFLVEFAEPNVYRTVLRQILRGLVAKRGRDPNLPAWKHDNLLFICTTRDYRRFTFAHFRGQQANRAVLATFSWEHGDTHIRTLCEFNLPALAWPDDPSDVDSWLSQWRRAFDVEAVTTEFFREYREVFEKVEVEVRRSIPNLNTCRLYTQRLFNRLMFLYFIEKKGWLSFERDKQYLRALFNKAEATGENFLRDRLYWLFFFGLSNVGESRELHSEASLRDRRGDVPYLNGGLFDIEDQYDVRDGVNLNNDAFRQILDLFERYNFTVTESTPLDVQVAVDPEMLGKVFEELVTGRHESGSYYTPRPIVSFMCREALKGYLEGYENLVDEHDPAGITVVQARELLARLAEVRVVDPACGSGAYLLGMLHELRSLTQLLDTRAEREGSRDDYHRKLQIIQNNLYGVDNDEFAVQIARLRLWLSLAVDYEEGVPEPLPNLDLKIERGDSLTAPNPEGLQQGAFRDDVIRQYRIAKTNYLTAHGDSKVELRGTIDALRKEIAVWTHGNGTVTGFDWAVEFAEVFGEGGFAIVWGAPLE